MNDTQRVGTVLDNKYELISLIGEGGMGAVYEARHKLINRRLAVKFLHPQYANSEEVVTRFQREAQAAAKIGHENIIEITDMGTASDGAPYIVMEYLDGTDVKALLEQHGALPVGRTANIMVQALSALQAAHDAGIIHRDLKPENIFLITKSSNRDYVKLLDFGISKFKELETDGARALTQTGTVLGTPHYMSPEQARGEQNLTPRSDIYAMGVILYQMLTGHLPFDAPNYNALLIKILTEDPPPPESLNPDLPEPLVAAIKKAMDRNPDNRFASCDEFKAALVPFVPGLGDITGNVDLSTISQTAVRRAVRTNTMTPLEMTQSGIAPVRSRKPLVVGGVIAATAAVVVGVVVALSGGGKKDRVPPAAALPAAPVQPVASQEGAADSGSAASGSDADRAEDKMQLTISAEPAEAVITIDGAKVSNPYTGLFVKSAVNRSIEVTAPGYEPIAEMVVFDRDRTLHYQLEKKQVAEPNKTKTRRKKDRKKAAPQPAPAVDKPADKPKPTKKRRKIDYSDPWS